MDKLFLADGVKKILKVSSVSTDNTIFRLHYKLTAAILILCSLLVTGTQFFGNPINCIVQKDFPVKVVESFCWVESTFTLPKALAKKVGHEVPYPGVDKHLAGDEILEHAYYQWVCFVLFIQAILFLLPRIIWKGWEGEKIKSLLLELNKPVLEYSVRHKKYNDIVQYFTARNHGHQDYFFKFFFCEILNFVNVVGQIFLVNKFLGGEFTTYGSDVFQYMMADQEDRIDPMIRVFPRMTKCTFHHYGPSGDVQKLDTFCVLPINILNEKVYVLLWFWFVLLAIFSGLALFYRVVMILWPHGRYLLIKSYNYLTKAERLGTVMHYMDYGDWFVLYMLGNNIDNLHFRELIDEMADKFEEMFPSQTSIDESEDALKFTPTYPTTKTKLKESVA